MSLTDKILFIQSSTDEKFRLILNEDWGSSQPDYRQKIRSCLSEKFSVHFSREQLVKLSDLTWRPLGSDRRISISHCETLGGFALSTRQVGFDVEKTERISVEILKRISGEDELKLCPQAKFLWVAKEAAFKAVSEPDLSLVIADLVCYDWQSYFENQVFGFRIKSKKTLDFGLNKGLVFSDGPHSYAVFFK